MEVRVIHISYHRFLVIRERVYNLVCKFKTLDFLIHRKEDDKNEKINDE